ncbi:hypothetical protein PHYSODRAFT_534685 [Phytophthora sojae]|uniref:Nucleolar 27S pre-rRNA processing Urb2/Npa2 C-terminal domain-containing protein n=1 Tax=Phytophthora sojae (strain P6497) TaxID=1094619 RepID=G5AHB3_PHYSP|nr:hypothetical protein PHYSODRAFT_534685 [Phytophthora sojae]EGZ05091.1 hypothetical protein PHYSODRAFT_534685 [Phytophthora sojae]|eukprot:XP_009539463.1 hypothetical protein PHYSODRAFT_534685 [Phytophthora sojae]
MDAEGFSLDAALSLVRWQRSRRGYDGDAELLRAGLALLAPPPPGAQSALQRAERAFNLPWQRIAAEVLQFAVFVVTKAKRDAELRPEQPRQALRLLQLALNALAVEGDAQLTTLPLSSCNLLLGALVEALETRQQDDALQTLRDVKAVFLYLFGLPSERAAAATPSFQMYRPPTNVYADFLKRALTAAFRALQQLQERDVDEEEEEIKQQQELYVDVVHAALSVFQELQKTQTNKKKVFLAIAKTSLRDIVAYRHALVKLQTQGVPGVEAATQLLDRVVEDALFDAEHIRQYDGAMDDKKSKKRRKAGGAKAASGLVSYQKNLFDELQSLLSDKEVDADLKASVGGFFEVLVRGFAVRIRAAANTKIEDTKTDLKTSRKRAAIVIATTSTTYSPFKFWSELCAVAFSAFQQEADKNDFLPVLVTLYNALFRALCECDVYRVTEDTEDRGQFLTMEKVLSAFLEVLDVEHGDEVSSDADRASEECEVVTSAVRCSPNLVNCCIVPILELLGLQALIHAYDSMRLLDAFLKASFTIERAHEGLYKLFALPSCETTLRKAFMALPPGQMDVLWKLLVEQVASFSSSEDTVDNARGVAVARLLFQTFVQEIHVVPQNRSKVLGLVSYTHEKLLSSFADELDQVTGSFTSYQRELFCIFGELLMFDSVLSSTIREQTFDQLFKKLEGDRFGTVMKQLLATSSPKKKKKNGKAKSTDSVANNLSTSHGLGAAGIVKLCVYWLRNMGASSPEADDAIKVSREGREQATRLVIEYVINWKCWEAVSFHLPELMANASDEECDRFLREILSAFLCETVSGELDGSARRIICDAEFYEIPSLRKVAPTSFNTLGQQFVDEAQRDSLTNPTTPMQFFSFLSEIPRSYLKPEESGDLLSTALSLYKAITESKTEIRRTVLAWIQQHFKAIGVEVNKSGDARLKEQMLNGARFITSQIAVDNALSVSLVSEVLGYYLEIGDGAFAGELLSSVLGTKSAKKNSSSKKLQRAVIVVEALAMCRGASSEVSKEEKEFVESVVDVTTRDNVCENSDGPLPFEVLTALLKYQSILQKQAYQQKKTITEGRVLELLVKHVGAALAKSMKLVSATSESTNDSKLQDAAWSFYANFCLEYASFRSFVNPLETFGCLLAVAISLVSRDQSKAEQALQAVIGNANKDEFRLLLTTIVQELVANECQRKQGALRALCLLLGGDRKLNAARRQLLNERKESIVEALLQNFAVQSPQVGVVSSDSNDDAVALRVWNLKAFTLVFCKAELFTWKTHELQHVFTGFQPIVAAVSCWQAGTNPFNAQDLHEVWTLSYTLLLRIVRNHFASLVNGIPHLVQAANALLQLLVLTSASSEYSQYCSEWSSNLARLYGYMKEHDVQLRKHVVYMLMAFLVGVTRDKLAVRFQQKLRPGVFALLDVCSPYEKEQLFGALDSTGKSLLKTLDTNYKLTHRYVGKV